MKTRAALLLLGSLLSARAVGSYYLPGVDIHSFQDGEEVRLYVNKMTSTSHLYDMDYYKFAFCQPEGGPKMLNENLGELLAGDRLESSPYYLAMKKDMFCEHVCISNLGRVQVPNTVPSRTARLINKNYHNNWVVDNLPAASKMETDTMVTTRFWQGFPVGFVAEDNQMAYIHNHVNIELFYHRVIGESSSSVPEYRIVRFTVEPFSIKHDIDNDSDGGEDAEHYLPTIFKIKNPIASCDPSIPYQDRPHTTYDMVIERDSEPQPASGKVLFTYDVIWTEDPFTPWSSRWDIYLNMNSAVPTKVHWVSIFHSVLVACALASFFVYKLRRHLRQDLSGYSALNMDEEGTAGPSTLGNNGSWIRAYAHVFRPPTERPRLLAVSCGTGAQLLLTVFLTISLCILGFLNPARRGSLLMGSLFLFHLNGGINGYVTARLYATFQGEDPHNATGMAATLFPGIALGIFLVLNLLAFTQESTDCVPILTFLVLPFLWALIDVPLVFIGAHRGKKGGSLVEGSFLAATSTLAPPIPYQPCYLSLPVVLLGAGIFPFGSIFVEFYYILASAWQEYYYYVFGFLLLAFFVMILLSVEITLVFTYFQLRRENFVWWWRSFGMGGGMAIWAFLYSMFYYLRLGANGLASFMSYFLYMFLVCLALQCMMGCVGVISSIWFHKKMFTHLEAKLGSEFLHESNKDGETMHMVSYREMADE